MLKGIQRGRWRNPIEALRELGYGTAEYAKAKSQLPCVMLSASTQNGGHKKADLLSHTGLLQIDCDGLGSASQAEALRDQLASDPHIMAAWVSPGGLGVKGLLRIRPDFASHGRSFSEAQSWLRERHGAEIDAKCSDPCRLCFVSFDPDLRFNPEAVEMPLPEASPTNASSNATHSPNSSPLLPPEPTSYILHNRHSLFDDFPRLRPIYFRHVVEPVGKPQRGMRNEAIVEITSQLFYVVHPPFIYAMLRQFHSDNSDVMHDYPLAAVLSEAKNLVTGAEATFVREELSVAEARVYSNLSGDPERCAFRICRSLSLCTSEAEYPPPFFFLSAEQLGDRIGKLSTQAWRILNRFKELGIVEQVRAGERRKEGQKGKAATFRWLLPLKQTSENSFTRPESGQRT